MEVPMTHAHSSKTCAKCSKPTRKGHCIVCHKCITAAAISFCWACERSLTPQGQADALVAHHLAWNPAAFDDDAPVARVQRDLGPDWMAEWTRSQPK
jgi:hypothetical protein